MADDALKFKVDLVGNMVQELVASGKAANAAEGNIQALTASILGLTEASKKKDDHGFFTFDLAEGAKMAVELVTRLAEAVYDLGKEIINVAAETQDLNVALRLTAGADNLEAVEAIAGKYRDTRFDDGDVKRMLLPLLDVGVGKDNPGLLQNIATAATDMAARYADPAKAAEVLDAFKRIHTKREVSSKMLLGVGVNEKDFYQSLGETLGRSAAQAEAAVKAGKVRADQLEAELLYQIAQREGGKLGTATDEAAKTLGTTLARLKNIPHNLFEELADSPGLARMQARVDRFIDSMSGEGGKRIVDSLGSAIDSISAKLLGDGDAADKFIATLVDGIPRVVKLFEDLATIISSIAVIIGPIADAIHSVAQADNRYERMKAQGGFVGAVAHVPFARMLLSDPDKPAQAPGALTTARLGYANDFIWRNGQAIEISPDDNLVGFKKGGSLGLGDETNSYQRCGAAGGGVTFSPTYAPVYQLTPGTTEEQVRQADELNRVALARMLDEAQQRFGARAA